LQKLNATGDAENRDCKRCYSATAVLREQPKLLQAAAQEAFYNAPVPEKPFIYL
jgi:hypothetical protein